MLLRPHEVSTLLGCILGDQQLGLKVVMQGYQEAGLQRQVRTSGGRNPAQVYAHFISSYTFLLLHPGKNEDTGPKGRLLIQLLLAFLILSHNAENLFSLWLSPPSLAILPGEPKIRPG